MPSFDAVASLRIWAVEGRLGAQVLRIPPLPAADWLPILMRADVLGLLELVEDAEIADMLLDGTVGVPELKTALESMLEQGTGRSTWSALLIAGVAAQNWHVVGGDLARRGVRFEEIPIGAALDAFYGSLASAMDEKELVKFNSALDRGAPATTSSAPPQRGPAPRPVPASAERYVRERPRTRQRRPQDRVASQSAAPTPPPGPPADSDPPASSSIPDAPPRPAG